MDLKIVQKKGRRHSQKIALTAGFAALFEGLGVPKNGYLEDFMQMAKK